MVQVASSFNLDDNHRGHQPFFHHTAAQQASQCQLARDCMQKLS
jgi:hypothetical protein